MTAMWQVIFYTGFAVIAFYFFLLRPVLQDQKLQKKAVRELMIGDEVITTGGLIGELKDVIVPVEGPTEYIIEIAPEVRVRAVADGIKRRLSTLEGSPPESQAAAPSGEVTQTRA